MSTSIMLYRRNQTIRLAVLSTLPYSGRKAHHAFDEAVQSAGSEQNGLKRRRMIEVVCGETFIMSSRRLAFRRQQVLPIESGDERTNE